MKKVKEIIKPFQNKLNDFVQATGTNKVRFFYVQIDGENTLVDIKNTYLHFDDDGQIIIRINDFINTDEEVMMNQVYQRAYQQLTVAETLTSLQKDFDDFLEENGEKVFKLGDEWSNIETDYYIEEDYFADALNISICNTNSSGIAIDPIHKAQFVLDNSIIILKIE